MEEIPNEKGVHLSGILLADSASVEGYRWALPNIALSVTSFQTNRWTVMRNAFDIAQFETRLPGCPLTKTEFVQLPVEEKYEHASHLFANQVTNDGYGAPVLLCRPKTEAEKSGKKSIEGPVVPPRYVPTVVIGLDPGMQAICTAAREDFRSEEQQTRHIISVSTREYRHLTGFNRFRAWNEGQKKCQPEYQTTIGEMPSFKTASCEQYLERLKYFWHHVEFLMHICVDRPFLKRKFFQKRMARVAVDKIARRIVPTKCKGVVLVRNRAEVEFEDKKCHAVLRCDHENCEARYWDRDVSTAINMVDLLKSD
ncbi:hypothetical protein JG687_00015392 [Phytophthora cactorum]|uniref:Uncharacterized protein n=1 Tax=Phytophthora cactorum TaxID=29920 RepID=A0A8T1TTH3_9STRA|nr:hypothetical protein JG687_00015392 [Phytophthora cactorum]